MSVYCRYLTHCILYIMAMIGVIACSSTPQYLYTYTMSCDNCGKSKDGRMDIRLDTTGSLESPIALTIKNTSDSVLYFDVEKMQYYFHGELLITPAVVNNPLVSESTWVTNSYNETIKTDGVVRVLTGADEVGSSTSYVENVIEKYPKVITLMPGMVYTFLCKTNFSLLLHKGKNTSDDEMKFLKDNLQGKSFAYGLVYTVGISRSAQTHLIKARIIDCIRNEKEIPRAGYLSSRRK